MQICEFDPLLLLFRPVPGRRWTTGGPPGGAPKPGSAAFEFAKKQKGFNDSRRTAAKGPNGEILCKAWNDQRDGPQCKFGANCKHKHACDVLVDGKACMAEDHCRMTHP